jgi:hypothetical protein
MGRGIRAGPGDTGGYKDGPRETGLEPLTMRTQGIAARAVGLAALAACAVAQVGCTSILTSWSLPNIAQVFEKAPPMKNPLPVPAMDFEVLWNKTVAEVNKHFPIASENRLARTIRTDELMTGTLIEPWTRDAVTFRDRLEATLQTLRKFAVVQIDLAPSGGYLVKVEVNKELEDMVKPASQPAGRAAFYNDFPVNRTRDVVNAVPTPLGWIWMGRDTNLEQNILQGIKDALLL